MLSEQQRDHAALLVEGGDEMALKQWCQLHELDLSTVKKWARTGALAAGLVGAIAGTAKAGDDIPDYIRKMANQTQFAQQAQGQSGVQAGQPQQGPAANQRHSDEQKRIDAIIRQQQQGQRDQPRVDVPRRNDQPRYDDRRRWDGNRRGGYGYGSEYGYEDDPYWSARQMDMEMRRRLWWQQQQSQRWFAQQPYRVIQEPVDQFYDQGAVPDEMDDTEEETTTVIRYNLNGKQMGFIPNPSPIELAKARKLKAPLKKVHIRGRDVPIDAYVYELDDVTYVVAMPGQY